MNNTTCVLECKNHRSAQAYNRIFDKYVNSNDSDSFSTICAMHYILEQFDVNLNSVKHQEPAKYSLNNCGEVYNKQLIADLFFSNQPSEIQSFDSKELEIVDALAAVVEQFTRGTNLEKESFVQYIAKYMWLKNNLPLLAKSLAPMAKVVIALEQSVNAINEEYDYFNYPICP